MSLSAETDSVEPVVPPGRLAVLVSGNGSNLQAVLDACADGRLNATVAVVVSNNADAFALTRADWVGVPTVVATRDGRTRVDYDRDLAQAIAEHDIDLVVLAGWDRLLTATFVSHYPVINLHPAKPGAFPGLGAIERAYQAWTAGAISSGGVMVHHVPDEGVDCGPVIDTEEVPFHPGDTLNTFTERVHRTEHRLLVSAIAQVLPSVTRQTLR